MNQIDCHRAGCRITDAAGQLLFFHMQPPLYRKIVSFYNAVIKIIAYRYEFFIVFYVLAVIIIKYEIFLHICPDRHIDISKLLC